MSVTVEDLKTDFDALFDDTSITAIDLVYVYTTPTRHAQGLTRLSDTSYTVRFVRAAATPQHPSRAQSPLTGFVRAGAEKFSYRTATDLAREALNTGYARLAGYRIATDA